ncbi:MAG TPA: hypothetical protein VN634_10060 [Candidatus Limnocylindrales bacterium]|nr:hypothetical protein [Candidatus Limnocylindrales bacterium]
MFAGHYTSAFVAKRAAPRAPLWLLLLAAQFVDVLWVLAILAGVEHARLDHSLLSNPLDLYDMPWTHSLAGSVVWSAVAFAGARRWLGLATREAAAVAAVTLSHWFLDLVVHRPDLTIAGGTTKLGLALWNHPVAAWLLEVVLVVGSVQLVMTSLAGAKARTRCFRLGIVLVVLQTATTFGPIPQSVTAMVMSTLAVYVLVTLAGRWVEGR